MLMARETLSYRHYLTELALNEIFLCLSMVLPSMDIFFCDHPLAKILVNSWVYNLMDILNIFLTKYS